MLTASGSFAIRTVAPPTRGREDEVDSLTGVWRVVDNDDSSFLYFRRELDDLLMRFGAGVEECGSRYELSAGEKVWTISYMPGAKVAMVSAS